MPPPTLDRAAFRQWLAAMPGDAYYPAFGWFAAWLRLVEDPDMPSPPSAWPARFVEQGGVLSHITAAECLAILDALPEEE